MIQALAPEVAELEQVGLSREHEVGDVRGSYLVTVHGDVQTEFWPGVSVDGVQDSDREPVHVVDSPKQVRVPLLRLGQELAGEVGGVEDAEGHRSGAEDLGGDLRQRQHGAACHWHCQGAWRRFDQQIIGFDGYDAAETVTRNDIVPDDVSP